MFSLLPYFALWSPLPREERTLPPKSELVSTTACQARAAAMRAHGTCVEHVSRSGTAEPGVASCGRSLKCMPLVLMQGFFRKALESRVTAGLLLAAAAFLLGSAAVAGTTKHANTSTAMSSPHHLACLL